MSTALIFSIAAFIYLLFIWKSGKVFPILYLFLFVYFIQYVFSVYLIYNEYPILRRQMTISQDLLFSYTIPALLFLFAGVFLFNKDISLKEYVKKIDKAAASRLGHLLLFISFAAELLPILGIPGIGSILSFTYYLRYIGAMCYLFSPSTINYVLLVGVYMLLARDALQGGVFIDFFMWGAYLFFFISMRYNFSFKVRSTFILIAVPLLITIQAVKDEYRQQTWSGKEESGLGLLTDLARQNNGNDAPYASSDGVISTVGRLNQGWHLGMVLKHVPSKEPFSSGDDFISDLGGVLIPRIFSPDKKFIGSQDKFEKFTGHTLHGSTSMTIGVLGDFYINFGRWGSFIGLFIFGAVMARLFYGFVKKYVIPDPINIIWIPFLFSYLVRANNDFYMVTNSLVKGFLIFLFVNYLRKRFWPERSPVINR